MTDRLHLGYSVPDGEDVSIPVFHTVTTGITRHGKSETKKALAQRARDAGFTVLVFDTKTPRDYETIGADIPIYLEEHTNPTVLKGLLESKSGMSLSFQYAELIKMYNPGDTYQSILTRIQQAMDEDRHPVEEDKLRVLEHLLSDLAADLNRVTVSDGLELTEGAINVMDLHEVADSLQQLAIASSVQEVKDNRRDTIVVVDEAHNFMPQGRQPPARDPLVNLIREGGAGNNWLWISDQTITGVDKDPLKQVGVWILGKQREKNEAKRVLDQIPGSTSYTKEDVMTLGKGQFIVAMDDAQPLTYVQPAWMSDDDAQRIAREEESATDYEPPESEKTEIDMDETLQEKDEQIRKQRERIAELETELSRTREEKNELEEKIDQIFVEENVPDPDAFETAEISEDRIREVVEDYLTEMEIPESIRVDRTIPRVEIHRTVEPVAVEFETDKGKVLWLYAKGEFPEDKFTTGDIEDRLENHGYNATVRRTNILNELCQMGFCEAIPAGNRKSYRVVMDPEEAKDRGLLVVDEVVA